MSFQSNRELKRLAKFAFNTKALSDAEFRAFVLSYLLNLAQSVADIEDRIGDLDQKRR